MSRLLAFAVTVLALMSACAAQVWAVNGVVVDTNAKPIAQAKVWALLWDKKDSKPTLFYTDSTGKFSFEPTDKGLWHYIAVADGFSYAMARQESGKKDLIKIKLWPEKKINGQVVDPNGKPVPNADVRITGFHGHDSNGNEVVWCIMQDRVDFAGRTRTDKDGRFVLRHLPDPSTFRFFSMGLTEIAAGRALVERSLSYPGMESDIKIIDPLGCSVSGTVYLPGKSGPAPKGLEIVVDLYGAGAGIRSRTANLDSRGRFSFRDLPPGAADLMLTAQDRRGAADRVRAWALPAKTLDLTAGKARDIELVMVPGVLIRGKVVDKATGQQISRGSVSVQHAGRPDGEPDRADVNDKGEFALRVVPGKVSISLLSCQIGKDYCRFEDERQDPPSTELTVQNGKDVNDVVLNITAENRSNMDYQAAEKPIAPDFQLKPGTYQLTWDTKVDATGNGFSREGCYGDGAKAKMRRLPLLKSKNPIYLGTPLDGVGDSGLLLAIFDESRGTDAGYDTAYIDANRNGDLTDDKPIKWRTRNGYYRAPWVTVQAHQGTGPDGTDHPIRLRWWLENGRPITMQRMGGWKGTLDSTKGAVQAIMIDSNGNGTYNDRFSCPNLPSKGGWPDVAWGDCVYADTNGFGRAVASQWSPHSLAQGGVNVLGDKGFLVTANSAGNEITVAPYIGPMGKLLVRGVDINGMSGPVTFLNLVGKARVYNYGKLEGQAISLPAGDYALGYCGIELQSGKQKLHVGGNINKVVEIKPDEQTTFDINGKPILRILPGKSGVVFKQKTDECMAWDIRIGDTLTDVSLRNDNDGPTPKVKFDSDNAFLELKPQGGG